MLKYIDKPERIIFTLENGEKVVIPSRLFPLESGPYRLITSENTEPVKDEEIIRIFDSIDYSIGHCFSNSQILVKALTEAGYPAKQYVGWVFPDREDYPIHHSFVMLYDHLLDLSIEFLYKDMQEMGRKQRSADEAREVLIQQHEIKKSMKNHEKCNFGKCDSMYIYVAAEGSADEGKERNRILRREYPNHPSFKNVTNGITKTQQMMLQRNIK